jgi:hypothetical protein
MIPKTVLGLSVVLLECKALRLAVLASLAISGVAMAQTPPADQSQNPLAATAPTDQPAAPARARAPSRRATRARP